MRNCHNGRRRRGPHPPRINIKGQSLLPGNQAEFLFYLKPGPQCGIVLCLKGHRVAPEWTQTDSAWQSKHPPRGGRDSREWSFLLPEEMFFLQASVGIKRPRVSLNLLSGPQFPRLARCGHLTPHAPGGAPSAPCCGAGEREGSPPQNHVL